ncbi:endonuclease SmrB [Alteromonas sp. ASW11-36]|uniref:Ribosome rescue factor SmrB n=1 Tax=Alteromonas arenosi TaxID=3055817 RepID=A0ABT7SV18_9ALTE|nr:endonuclease SmrB [Alteromonas sp. ASW11-36]MDM7860036.1 endonuclease SmrB [Alteromonas sp. ASW11-36]
MSNKDESNEFRQALGDVKPLAPNDKVNLTRKDQHADARKQRRRDIAADNRNAQQANAYFAFSDAYEAHFDTNGPLKYVAQSTYSDELKRLRRGDYDPELILDLHGMNRANAKAEIAALLHAAKRQHFRCVCIVHGIGSGVLKLQVPNWLVQHPDVLAFHQAPLEWGGNGALLVLLRHADPKLGESFD